MWTLQYGTKPSRLVPTVDMLERRMKIVNKNRHASF